MDGVVNLNEYSIHNYIKCIKSEVITIDNIDIIINELMGIVTCIKKYDFKDVKMLNDLYYLINIVIVKEKELKNSSVLFEFCLDNNLINDVIIRKQNELCKIKDELYETIMVLIKKIFAIGIVFSLPINTFLITKDIVSKVNYQTVTKTYNSYTDDVNESISNNYFLGFNDKDSVKVVVYRPSRFFSLFFGNKDVYDLSDMDLNSIDEYINYFNDYLSLNYDDEVDYFEIIYTTVSNDLSKIENILGTVLGLLFSSLIVLLFISSSSDFTVIVENEIDDIKELLNDLVKYNRLSNEQKLEASRLSKLVLDRVNSNDELKLKFNSEVNRYKDVIDVNSYEIIESNKVKKLR